MRELKKPLSFNEQLEQLKSHGMLIDDEEKALEVLRRVNYYRFTGYALHYRKGPHDSDYVDGTTFEMVYRIYQFDEAMRNLLKRYIETAEVYYRTQISYGFCMAKCTPPPHDQHYDEDNFFNKKGYQEIRKSFSRERDRYKDSLIVKHHVSEFGGKMPLWVVVDLLSFSNLSKLYSTMYITEKEDIAAAVGTGRKTLTNHLHCISVLRNKCAHAARLYDSTFYPKARFSRSFLNKTGILADSFFAYVVVLYRRLPGQDIKDSFLSGLLKVLGDFRDDINLDMIGFPKDWVKILV